MKKTLVALSIATLVSPMMATAADEPTGIILEAGLFSHSHTLDVSGNFDYGSGAEKTSYDLEQDFIGLELGAKKMMKNGYGAVNAQFSFSESVDFARTACDNSCDDRSQSPNGSYYSVSAEYGHDISGMMPEDVINAALYGVVGIGIAGYDRGKANFNGIETSGSDESVIEGRAGLKYIYSSNSITNWTLEGGIRLYKQEADWVDSFQAGPFSVENKIEIERTAADLYLGARVDTEILEGVNLYGGAKFDVGFWDIQDIGLTTTLSNSPSVSGESIDSANWSVYGGVEIETDTIFNTVDSAVKSVM